MRTIQSKTCKCALFPSFMLVLPRPLYVQFPICYYFCLYLQPLSQALIMHGLTEIEQWAVGFYVRAMTTSIAQDQEILRLEKEAASLNRAIQILREVRALHLRSMSEVD